MPDPLKDPSEPVRAPPPPPTQGPVAKTAIQELREEVARLRERVAVLEAASAQRTLCPHCGAPGVECGMDAIGSLRCMKCMHRWWKGGGP